MSDPEKKLRDGRNGGKLRVGGPGRPKGALSLKTLLAKELSRQGKRKAQNLVNATIDQAEQGNAAALKIVWDRIDGPVIDRVELSGPDGGPVELFTRDLDRFYGGDSDVPENGSE